MRSNLKIVKEGIPFIAGLGVLGVCLWFVIKSLGVVLLILSGFCLYFFRDPKRAIPQGKDLILSPADGRVMEINEENNKKVIRIFLSIFNVHIQRSPFPGKIKSIEYKPGKFLPAMDKNAHAVNEQNLFTIETTYGEIMVSQIAGIIARRVVSWIKQGDKIKAGQKIGIIRFGSQVDVCLPMSAEIIVKENDKLEGGTSVIGYMRG